MTRMTASIRRLWRADSGVVSVEAALITPIFLILLIMLIEVVRLNFIYTMAEQSVFHGIRVAATDGRVAPDEEIRRTFAVLAGKIVDPSVLTVTVESAPDVFSLADGVTQPDAGKDREVVTLTLEIAVPLLGLENWRTPLFGHRRWQAHYRNEPRNT